MSPKGMIPASARQPVKGQCVRYMTEERYGKTVQCGERCICVRRTWCSIDMATRRGGGTSFGGNPLDLVPHGRQRRDDDPLLSLCFEPHALLNTWMPHNHTNHHKTNSTKPPSSPIVPHHASALLTKARMFTIQTDGCTNIEWKTHHSPSRLR